MLFRDSKGKKSWTVTLVVPTWLIMVGKFLVSGVQFAGITFASVDFVSFGAAITAVIAPLVARDAIKNIYNAGPTPPNPS